MTSVEAGGSVVFVQLHPVSIVQVELQPSPEAVFPSSHCSPGNTSPSPHTAVHVPPEQCGSIVHVGEHPSYGMVFPSSHSSSPSLVPSPQVVWWQADAGGGDGFAMHAQPGSILQVELHPAVPSVLPTSHCSLPATIPSPHSLATHLVS